MNSKPVLWIKILVFVNNFKLWFPNYFYIIFNSYVRESFENVVNNRSYKNLTTSDSDASSLDIIEFIFIFLLNCPIHGLKH